MQSWALHGAAAEEEAVKDERQGCAPHSQQHSQLLYAWIADLGGWKECELERVPRSG